MRILVAMLLILVAGILAAAWWVSGPAFDEPYTESGEAFSILPLDVAATFAMSRAGNVYMVLAADAREATVIDLNESLGTSYTDSLQAFAALGFDGLAALQGSIHLTIPLTSLGVPLRTAYPHIGAGTNFRAHAEEVGLDGEPFLFPKLSEATPWNAAVPKRARLDYEVELCAVTLSDYSVAAPTRLGYLLCNDFTDRWGLLREIDLDSPMGRTGFPDAKGGSGMLPVGPFLLIPRDAAAFYSDLNLSLGLNGNLRQQTRAGLMIWSPDEIARRALEDCGEHYLSRMGNHSLTDCESIPAGTLILTGTPAGVMFHFLNIWSPMAYLQGGDEVKASVEHLGRLHNVIGDNSE